MVGHSMTACNECLKENITKWFCIISTNRTVLNAKHLKIKNSKLFSKLRQRDFFLKSDLANDVKT